MRRFKWLLGGLSLLLFTAWVNATPVNVNKADAMTIAESLKGIGDVKAQAIVAYRGQNGDFTSVDQLLDIKGIGGKTLEKNRADILLSDE